MKCSIWLGENDLYTLEPLTDKMIKKVEEKLKFI